MDNVHYMPSPLERLADKLRGFLTRDAASRQDWIEIQMGKCLTLAEMRDQIPPNIEFGRWCDENGFGNDVLDRNTRAVAIEMGDEPEALRACLEATQRRSLREIYRLEFPRFHSPVKTTKTRSGRKKTKVTREMIDEIRRRLEADIPMRQQELMTLFNAKTTTILRAILQAQVEHEMQHVTPAIEPLPPSEMAPTMQQRYEAQLRAAEKKLRKELQEEIIAEISKVYDGYVRFQNNRVAKADRVLASHKGVMSRAVFRQIKACLHPDHCTFAYAAEALRLFSEMEDVLVKPDEPALSGERLPQTAAELMEWRKRYGR
jgi:hypothetical protein